MTLLIIQKLLLASSLVLVTGSVIAADNLIPDATIVEGERNIARTWLAGPTTRYPHGILGDDIEATTLVVETRSGQVFCAEAPGKSVFEDLVPRLIDIDGDNTDEVLTILADWEGGARLALYHVAEDGLELRAQTHPIGTGFRWLNPLGWGDIDGDGQTEIVYIQTPHIGGIVIAVRESGKNLVPLAAISGYSNHAIGSIHQDLGVVVDLDQDGVHEIIVPDQSRTRLAILYYDNDSFEEFWISERGPGIKGQVSYAVPSNQVRYETWGNPTQIIDLPTFKR